MVVGIVSLMSVGVLFAQQPQGQSAPKPAAAAAQPAAQGQQPQAAQHKTVARATSHRAAAPRWTKAQVTQAQEGLKRAKVYNGPATGVLGRATRRAIRAFQREHKLTVNGQLSDSLLDMLKAIPQ